MIVTQKGSKAALNDVIHLPIDPDHLQVESLAHRNASSVPALMSNHPLQGIRGVIENSGS